MSLRDDIKAEQNTVTDRERREHTATKRQLALLQVEHEKVLQALNFIDQAEGHSLEPPTWLRPKQNKPTSATLMLALSDMHFDEVVDPAEVDGLNAYDRRIAELRLQRWVSNTIKLARYHLSGITYDGVVIALLGDSFSGDIHEELSETNADTMMGSVLHWSEQLAAAIEALHKEFGKVHVGATPGNHGRTSRKPRAKLRAKTNFDWLLAKMLERHFKDNKKVTFQIPEGADCLVNLYGEGHLFTHGDQVSGGGSGIGGIYPGIMRLRARKAQRYLATGQSFQTLWMGHWHQYIPTQSLVVNGSTKGLDEYAYINNFAYENPQQALSVIAPGKGIVFQAPVFVQDRRKEKW